MYEVAVIGSGLNGLGVAYLLGINGVKAKIFEEKTFGGNFKNDFRTSYISHQSLQMFSGIAEQVISKSGDMKNIYSFKNKYSPVVELGDGYSSMGYVVDNSLLKELLINAIRSLSNIEIVENTQVYEVLNHNEGVNINGEEFRVAICASGANSSVHELLGYKQEVKSYNQQAFVFDVSHAHEHKNIAVEAFDESGVIALLPKFDVLKSSVILSLKNNYADKLNNEQVLDFLRAKTQRMRHLGQIVEITTPISRYPLGMKYMKHQTSGNVFFIGDAFHAIHPVLGQGFNMSLKDIKKLCDAILKMRALGVPLHQCLKSLPLKNIANHVTMGFATHIFGKAFVSNNRITNFVTAASIYTGELVPTSFKTKFLQKLL